jgi:hypothetical protein
MALILFAIEKSYWDSKVDVSCAPLRSGEKVVYIGKSKEEFPTGASGIILGFSLKKRMFEIKFPEHPRYNHFIEASKICRPGSSRDIHIQALDSA